MELCFFPAPWPSATHELIGRFCGYAGTASGRVGGMAPEVGDGQQGRVCSVSCVMFSVRVRVWVCFLLSCSLDERARPAGMQPGRATLPALRSPGRPQHVSSPPDRLFERRREELGEGKE